jgi:predicted PurR-regulated permease PerM
MADEYNFKLNKSQGELLAKAISILSLAVVFAGCFFLVYLLLRFTSHFSSILLPPVVAIVMSMIFKPYYFWLYKHLWRIRWLALFVMFATIAVPIVLFSYIFGALLIEELVKLINAMPGYVTDAYAYLKRMAPVLVEFLDKHGLQRFLNGFNISDMVNINAVAQKLSGATVSIGSHILDFIGAFFSWLVLPVYIAIFLSSRPYSGRDVSKAMIFLPQSYRTNLAYLIDQFLGIVVVYFRAQVLVAFIQGFLFAILFHLLGLKYGLVIGVMLGLLNIVPYLGNILGWIIIIPLALFGPDGGIILLVKIIIAFCSVQALDSYFITPRVMKNKTGLNTFVIIFSLFFWSNVIGGALGMLLAIPLSAFVVVFWRLLKKEYFAESSSLSASDEEATRTVE